MDDLNIPDFLIRPYDPAARIRIAKLRRREAMIPYPRDGYLGKGPRQAARERLRNSRERHAGKCRAR